MANNLIKLAQLDPEISGYITGLLGQNFTSFAVLFGNNSGNFGSGVLYVNANQTLYGQNTFALSPNVPYSGGTGQAVSQQFVLDQVAYLETQLINPSGFATITGSQAFAGTQTFAFIQAETGLFQGACFVPLTSNPSGAVNLGFLQSLGLVYNTGNQNIGGYFNFAISPDMPAPIGNNSAVRYQDLVSASGIITTSYQTADNGLSSRIGVLETGNVAGFAGILSINGHSGRSIIKGCGGITVTQVGGLTRISGGNSYVNTKEAQVQSTAIPSGVSSYYIPFSPSFSSNPVVVGDLSSHGQSLFNFNLSGISESGFSVLFNSPINNTGYVFNSIAGTPDADSATIWMGTPITSGLQTQFIPFTNSFNYTPIVFGALQSVSGPSIYTHVISGTSTTGFYVVFNAPVASTGYVFNSFAASGIGTLGLTIVSVSGEQGPQGASPINVCFYDQTLITGSAIHEEFVSQHYTITGWAAGCNVVSASALSGTVYIRDFSNTKTKLFDFGIGASSFGQYSYFSSGYSVPSLSRIGIDLLTGSNDMSGLSIGIFGC